MMAAVLLTLLSLGYGYVLNGMRKSWSIITECETEREPNPISIVIAYRNEQSNLKRLIESLGKLNYPLELFEVILVNDHSIDESEVLINELRKSMSIAITCHSLDRDVTGKKNAIELGVSKSTFPTIATTDADCVVNENWLKSVNRCSGADFISSPVVFRRSSFWFSSFVELDFMSLIGLGGVLIQKNRPLLANGANMAFRKQAFEDVGGYKDNKEYSSGDDVFLLTAMSKMNKTIIFNKSRDAIVETEMPTTLSELFNQRIRWAKKTKHLPTKTISPTVFFLVAGYLGFALSPILLFYSTSVLVFGLVFFSWGVKLLADYRYFNLLTTFYKRHDLMKHLWWVEILHPFYIVIAGILSLFAPYKWKLRSHRNG